MKLEGLPRRKIRYWLFRFRTELENGVEIDDAPKGLKKKFEKLEWFQGWANYGVSWDIHMTELFRIVPLKKSLDDEWKHIIDKVAIELVPDEKFTDKIAKKKTKNKTKKGTK